MDSRQKDRDHGTKILTFYLCLVISQGPTGSESNDIFDKLGIEVNLLKKLQQIHDTPVYLGDNGGRRSGLRRRKRQRLEGVWDRRHTHSRRQQSSDRRWCPIRPRTAGIERRKIFLADTNFV